MCGLVGLFDLRGNREIDGAVLQAMNESIIHRGPDESGFHRKPGIGLGHRRLSIIDLSSGQQPLYNEDRSVCVTYNGEIYNFGELSRELTEKGHVFRTRCDTEVIVHAWEEWGARCVERFRGMFAFAVYDARQEIVFLGRDRLGIKPLYYAITDDGFLVFGSELKALLKSPNVKREIDPIAVEDYFSLGYIPDPRSIYRGVKKLPPAHTLVVRRGQPVAEPVEYWDVAFDDGATIDMEAACEELIERLGEAVAIRLISEVPLGAFLSGGVDSSAVVALMARQQDDPVNTCSIGFGEASYDETPYAEAMAKRYHTNHRTRIVGTDDFNLLLDLPGIYDEPFADSSAIPTYRVCEEARRHVTVALSGDGGDEVFAGYRRHRWHHYEELVRQRMPQALRGPLFGMLGRTYPKLDWAPKPLRAKSTLQAVARSSAEGYFHSVSILSDSLREELYSDSFKSELQGYRTIERFREIMERAPTEHHLSRIQYLDMKTYLPGDILTKVDRASMAHALEVRVPILDHPFVEWACRLPAECKLKGREGKYVFKKALEPLVSEDILYRPKMGFGVPLAEWFRGPLRNEVNAKLRHGPLMETGYFEERTIARFLDQHMSGLRDHSQPIWALLMFAGFLESVHEGNGVRHAHAPAEL